jgi:DNA-binding transcriptional MerR regulator
VTSAARFLSPSDAARHLGVSPKALRIYEERGLLRPHRSATGWRSYGPDQIARGRDIVELRALGLCLNQIARVLDGDIAVLERALADHEAALGAQIGRLGEAMGKVRTLRDKLVREAMLPTDAITQMRAMSEAAAVSFALPWPWGGELFELRSLQKLTHIVGPLGSGKTRLAMRLAEAIPGAVFIGLERLAADSSASEAILASDPRLERRVGRAIAAIEDGGGTRSDALLALLTAIEAEGAAVHVVDMLEQGLDAATQEALISVLRRRAATARPLIFLTRSTAILDLDSVGADEAILFCPANHSPPFFVTPCRGAPGFEALAMCLATPDVRARTAGVVAMTAAG